MFLLFILQISTAALISSSDRHRCTNWHHPHCCLVLWLQNSCRNLHIFCPCHRCFLSFLLLKSINNLCWQQIYIRLCMLTLLHQNFLPQQQRSAIVFCYIKNLRRNSDALLLGTLPLHKMLKVWWGLMVLYLYSKTSLQVERLFWGWNISFCAVLFLFFNLLFKCEFCGNWIWVALIPY